MSKVVSVGEIQCGNGLPFILLGGMNVLESRDLALRIAETFKEVTDRLKIPYVFKASFDKANRSSINSFRGPGLNEGLEWLSEIKETFGVEVKRCDTLEQYADAIDDASLERYFSKYWQNNFTTSARRHCCFYNYKTFFVYIFANCIYCFFEAI